MSRLCLPNTSFDVVQKFIFLRNDSEDAVIPCSVPGPSSPPLGPSAPRKTEQEDADGTNN